MSEPLTDLEKYIRGLPLSDENAALMEGREPAAEFSAAITSETKAKIAPETEDDIRWLRALTTEPGWEIFLRRLNLRIQNREEGAKLLSSVDPLNNQQAIVNEWTYIACLKQVMAEIRKMMHES